MTKTQKFHMTRTEKRINIILIYINENEMKSILNNCF